MKSYFSGPSSVVNISGGDMVPLSGFASLTAAVASIGSTPAILLIDEAQNVAAPVVIPATLFLFHYGPLLTQTSTGTIEFEGVGLIFPDSQIPLFSGFAAGELTWTGTCPQIVAAELIYSAGNSVTDRMNVLTAAFVGKTVTFTCQDSVITSAAVLNDNHSVCMQGTLTNTYVTHIPPPFTLGDNATFYAESWNPIFYESDVNTKTALVWTKDGAVNSHIKGVHFKGHVANTDPAGLAGCWLLNGDTSSIENCWFENCHSYNATVGKYPGEVGLSVDCDILNNYITGTHTQNIAVTSGSRINVIGNIVNLIGSANPGNAFVPIDVEPNNATDTLDDITITGNTLYSEGVTDINTFINVQADILATNTNRVTVTDNTCIAINEFSESNGNTFATVVVRGCQDVTIACNKAQGNYNFPIELASCRNILIEDNNLIQNEGAILLVGCADGYIRENTARNPIPITGGIYNALIEEREAEFTATSAGSVITTTGVLDNYVGYFKWKTYMEGLTVTFNNVDEVISTVDSATQLTSTTAVGTLTTNTFTTIVADTITITSHGFNTGARVRFTTNGVLPAGLAVNTTYFVIKIDANDIQIADTLANALAGTELSITTGTGTQTILPVLITKFANHQYIYNIAAQGVTLAADSASTIAPIVFAP